MLCINTRATKRYWAILLKLQKQISVGVFLARKHQKSRIFGPIWAKKPQKWPDFLRQPRKTH